MIQELAVGQRLPGKTSLPESTIFDFQQSGAYFQISFVNPTFEEINQIKRGKKQFGLIEKNGLIFFLFKSGNLNWMDAPYHVARSAPYTLESIQDKNMGYGMSLVFVDARTAIVKAMKLIGWPHDMSLYFKELVEKQKGTSGADYDKNVAIVYSKYTTEDLVKEARIFSI